LPPSLLEKSATKCAKQKNKNATKTLKIWRVTISIKENLWGRQQNHFAICHGSYLINIFIFSSHLASFS